MQESISSREETLYDCVQSLIAAEPRAKECYLSLGEHEQGQMILHGDSICSYERMQDFVKDLRG